MLLSSAPRVSLRTERDPAWRFDETKLDMIIERLQEVLLMATDAGLSETAYSVDVVMRVARAEAVKAQTESR